MLQLLLQQSQLLSHSTAGWWEGFLIPNPHRKGDSLLVLHQSAGAAKLRVKGAATPRSTEQFLLGPNPLLPLRAELILPAKGLESSAERAEGIKAFRINADPMQASPSSEPPLPAQAKPMFHRHKFSFSIKNGKNYNTPHCRKGNFNIRSQFSKIYPFYNSVVNHHLPVIHCQPKWFSFTTREMERGNK